MKSNSSGFTIIEMILASLLIVFFYLTAVKVLEIVKATMFQQVQASSLTEINALNVEITRSIRNAYKILFVSDARMELEIYNTKYPITDRRFVEERRRVVYEVVSLPVLAVQRIIYNSASPVPYAAADIVETKTYLATQRLLPPTEMPYFQAQFVEDNDGLVTYGAIRIKIPVQSPYTKRKYVPLQAEAGVYGQGI